MELKQLEYFVRVAELGSFTRAALQLGVAQPLLSRQVRQLEVELRQNLLQRNGRGAVVTQAGKRLLEHGRGILHQVAKAKEDMTLTRGSLAGTVSIGLPPSLSRLLTVPLTRAFREQLPQAQLTLTEGFSVAMLENLRRGNLDMAVLYNPVLARDLEQTLLHQEALVLISSARDRGAQPAQQPPPSMSLQAASRLPLLLPSRPNAFRQLLDHEMVRLGLTPNIVMQVDGLNAILSLVMDGVGHAVLPSYTLAHYPQSTFVVRAITQPALMSQLMLVSPSQRPSTLTQQKAKSLLQTVVQQALGSLTH